MIVCSCLGVVDGAVIRAIEGGARSVEAVGKACGAGTDCGGCEATIEELIAARSLVRSGVPANDVDAATDTGSTSVA